MKFNLTAIKSTEFMSHIEANEQPEQQKISKTKKAIACAITKAKTNGKRSEKVI